MAATSSRSRADVRAGKQAAREQRQDLAFNFAGKAVEDKSGPRDTHQVIVARTSTSKNWLEVLKQRALNNDSLYRSSMEFTRREQNTDQEPQVGTAHYLVIGYAKANLDKKIRTQDKSKNKQVVGVEAPEVILPWDDEKHPTSYVVTPILNFQPEQLQLFVLLEPKDGLCTPYQIGKDDVFYRFEYRDEETALVKRKRSWNRKIGEHSVRVGLPTAPSAKQERFKRAQNVGKVTVEAYEDCGNELKMLALAFKKNRDVWLLKEMQQVLERTDLDLAYRPLRSQTGLRAFVENDADDFSDEDAAAMVKEVSELWPDVKELTPTRVKTLKTLMATQEAEIKNFQLKGLLAEGMHKLCSCGDEIMDEKEFVSDLVSTLDRVLGKEAQPQPTASNFVIDSESQDAILSAIAAKLESILACYYSFSHQLNAHFGDHVLEGNGPADFWAKYAEAPDTDSCRAAFFHTTKFVVAEFTHVLHEGIVNPIHDLVELLKHLNLPRN